ncbi:MAG: D-alanyl-D-alanine carboxypeptidase/D-alanyl-D-alanine-endopeptidase [Phycisphaerae bacterium]|nr:D-alanyl-D-alanine carboxypeptidase/D-alanyl-D-alanine-endopeptidase [Phycisphaerae bacterium]
MNRMTWMVSVLLVVSAAWGQAGSASLGAGDVAGLVAAFEETHSARVGVSIVDLRNGQGLFVHREQEAMIPASNQKILTSAFALARLGAGGTFVTSVHATPRDVIVVGGFDPLLGDPFLARREGRSIYVELDRWAGAIRDAFGETIPGDLILAGRSESAALHPPDWERRHQDRWYGAAAADLNFHDNCFDVTFEDRGGTIQPVVAPAGRFIRVLNELQYQPQGRHLWRLQESSDGGTLKLTGRITGPAGDPLSVPMRDPRLTLGRVLADRLARAGVKLTGRLRVIPAGRVQLDQTRLLTKSETSLADVMRRANKRSLNLAAECMLLAAGDGTWDGGAKRMRDILIERYGLDPQTLIVRDGSGLSRTNRVTSDDVVKLLTALHKTDIFLASLSRSGVDGSLRGRLRDKAYRGRVAAKTGTVAGVRTLSGYILDERGTPVIAFSILANNLSGRSSSLAKQLQDQICRELVEGLE